MQNVLIKVSRSIFVKRCSLKMGCMVFQQHETALLRVPIVPDSVFSVNGLRLYAKDSD
jgi:hypothetical protein